MWDCGGRGKHKNLLDVEELPMQELRLTQGNRTNMLHAEEITQCRIEAYTRGLHKAVACGRA